MDVCRLSQELMQLHEELQTTVVCRDDPRVAEEKEDRLVEHFGSGVYVEYNNTALNYDGGEGSPVTVTCEERRSLVHHALDALQSRYAVCVAGQQGTGKTRGSMMHAIQMLLHQKAAVFFVSYKSEKMMLFLPQEDGECHICRGNATKFGESRFIPKQRIVAIIDPPEEGPYSSTGECRVLKFVSNNAEKHFRNSEKDGVLLVTSMPTEKEVLALTQVL